MNNRDYIQTSDHVRVPLARPFDVMEPSKNDITLYCVNVVQGLDVVAVEYYADEADALDAVRNVYGRTLAHEAEAIPANLHVFANGDWYDVDGELKAYYVEDADE